MLETKFRVARTIAIAFSVTFAGALVGSAALAAEPNAGALKQVSQQQQQPVGRSSAAFFLRNTNNLLPGPANKPKPKPAGTYSKTLTFTLSTTTPAPPPPVEALDIAHVGMHDGTKGRTSNDRTFRSRTGHLLTTSKGGNEVAVEGITLVHEGFARQ